MDFTKYDKEKLDYSLLPIGSIDKITEVLQHGAEKYDRDNWRKCEDLNRYYSALLRHLFAWRAGEELDEDSGLTHLAHMACNAVFLMELSGNHGRFGDLYKELMNKELVGISPTKKIFKETTEEFTDEEWGTSFHLKPTGYVTQKVNYLPGDPPSDK